MGQLIKLENYISRYQQDIFHYPSQFSRLKQENWKSLFDMWKLRIEALQLEVPEEEPQNQSFFSRWRTLFNKHEEIEVDPLEQPIPQSEDQLKQFFLDSIFEFQLNWASTTLSQMSFLDRNYRNDLILKYFLQRYPDTFLFMYKPIFKLKKAAVDSDLIMITPVAVYVIKLVEGPSNQTIVADSDRVWFYDDSNIQTKFMSPLLSLKRSAKIIQSIIDFHDLDLPVNRVVLSRTNTIRFNLEPYQTEYVDRDRHEGWLQRQRQLSSPLKHQQLKVAEALLNHSDTVSVNRPEWEQPEEEL